MAQMLVDGSLADTEAKGYLTESEALAEVKFHHLATDGWRQQVDALGQSFRLFKKQVCRNDGGVEVEEVEPLNPFLNPPTTYHIKTSVAHAGK